MKRKTWLNRIAEFPKVFMRGLHAQKNMEDLLFLMDAADGVHLDQHRQEALAHVLSSIKYARENKTKLVISLNDAESIFPLACLRFITERIKVCNGEYMKFMRELFPDVPSEVFSRQIRRR